MKTKHRGKLLVLIISLMMIVTLIAGLSITGSAAENVAYIDENGASQTQSDATAVASTTTEWTDGWYVVNSNVTIDSRVNVEGDAKLILIDGFTLTVNGGLRLPQIAGGAKLTIYGQTKGTGTLAVSNTNAPGIENMGTLTIVGGTVSGTSSGDNGIVNHKILTVQGGTVSGKSYGYSSGIYNSDTLNIQGGTVTAISTDGTGQGIFNFDGTLTVSGTDTVVNAEGYRGIRNFATLTVEGGTVTAIGDDTGFVNDDTLTVQGGIVKATAQNGTNINGLNSENIENCIVFDGTDGTVYGNYSLTEDFTVESGEKLTVPSGATLTVPVGITLTNNGTLDVQNGSLDVGGTLDSSSGNLIGNASWMYYVTNTLSNITSSGDHEAYNITKYTATLTATDGYLLPESITVKVSGTVLTQGYTYDARTGDITIECDYITGNIEIIASGARCTAHTYDHGCDPRCNKCNLERAELVHVYDNDCTDADCNNDGCSVMRDAQSAHSYTDCLDADCNNGGCLVTREAQPTHVYDEDCTDTTCNNEGCTVMRTAGTHDFTGAWQSDEDGHWHICSNDGCNVTDTKADHSDAENDNDHSCDVCERADVSDHAYGNATCTSPKTCSECGATTGEALGHTEETVAGKAATCTETGLTDGKKCSVCGETLTAQTDIAALGHEYDNACDADCDICGEERTPAEHSDADENSACDECGAELPKDGLGAGAIVAIVIGSVAVLGGGGAAVWLFVFKKKKMSDLSHK